MFGRRRSRRNGEAAPPSADERAYLAKVAEVTVGIREGLESLAALMGSSFAPDDPGWLARVAHALDTVALAADSGAQLAPPPGERYQNLSMLFGAAMQHYIAMGDGAVEALRFQDARAMESRQKHHDDANVLMVAFSAVLAEIEGKGPN